MSNQVSKQACDALVAQARIEGWSAGFDAAVDRNKSNSHFIRGIPVGIFAGVLILLAVQKFVLGIF